MAMFVPKLSIFEDWLVCKHACHAVLLPLPDFYTIVMILESMLRQIVLDNISSSMLEFRIKEDELRRRIWSATILFKNKAQHQT
eukprot:54573-Amphidinium_carterae.1